MNRLMRAKSLPDIQCKTNPLNFPNFYESPCRIIHTDKISSSQESNQTHRNSNPTADPFPIMNSDDIRWYSSPEVIPDESSPPEQFYEDPLSAVQSHQFQVYIPFKSIECNVKRSISLSWPDVKTVGLNNVLIKSMSLPEIFLRTPQNQNITESISQCNTEMFNSKLEIKYQNKQEILEKNSSPCVCAPHIPIVPDIELCGLRKTFEAFSDTELNESFYEEQTDDLSGHSMYKNTDHIGLKCGDDSASTTYSYCKIEDLQPVIDSKCSAACKAQNTFPMSCESHCSKNYNLQKMRNEQPNFAGKNSSGSNNKGLQLPHLDVSTHDSMIMLENCPEAEIMNTNIQERKEEVFSDVINTLNDQNINFKDEKTIILYQNRHAPNQETGFYNNNYFKSNIHDTIVDLEKSVELIKFNKQYSHKKEILGDEIYKTKLMKNTIISKFEESEQPYNKKCLTVFDEHHVDNCMRLQSKIKFNDCDNILKYVNIPSNITSLIYNNSDNFRPLEISLSNHLGFKIKNRLCTLSTTQNMEDNSLDILLEKEIDKALSSYDNQIGTNTRTELPCHRVGSEGSCIMKSIQVQTDLKYYEYATPCKNLQFSNISVQTDILNILKDKMDSTKSDKTYNKNKTVDNATNTDETCILNSWLIKRNINALSLETLISKKLKTNSDILSMETYVKNELFDEVMEKAPTKTITKCNETVEDNKNLGKEDEGTSFYKVSPDNLPNENMSITELDITKQKGEKQLQGVFQWVDKHFNCLHQRNAGEGIKEQTSPYKEFQPKLRVGLSKRAKPKKLHLI